MRWIALTGVNGFIGHNLTLEFLEQTPQTLELDVEMVVGSDLTSSLGRPTHQKAALYPNYRFCPAEELPARLEVLEREFGAPPLAVIHNGACSSTTETDPEIFRTLNVESSQQLFGYSCERKIPFLYASSASVYGDGSLGFDDSMERNEKYRPLNLYGRSKHQFDSWAVNQTDQPNGWFGLRYFNVFGPHEEHKGGQASLLHWGRRQILDHGELKLYRSHHPGVADGEQRRDFVSVFDVVRVTLGLLQLALNRPQNARGFVNIGRGEASTWLEAAQALFAALNREMKIQFVDMPEQLREHYQNYTCAHLGTLHRLGLEQPFLTLEEAFSLSLPSLRS